MKSVILLAFALFYLFPTKAYVQAIFKNGYIVTANNEKIDGSVKELFKRGKLIFLSLTHEEKTYTPAAIKTFSIDSTSYISYSNDFYEEIATGIRASLYKKLTDNSDEKIYNGIECVGFVKTTQGKPGDYYLLPSNKTELDLVTKKNFVDYFLKLPDVSENLVSKIKNKKLDYSQIIKAVELYNQ